MGKMAGMMEETRRQIGLAVPLTLANFLMFALQLISVVFVGNVSHESLAGASIAISFTNSVGFTVLVGASSALDTLCGQSFGAQSYRTVGIHLQRAMVIVLLLSIPLSFAMAFSGRILVFFRQLPELSMAAESYAHLMIPSLFAFGLMQCIIRFLQAQKIVLPIMAFSGLTALSHCFCCWFFTYRTGFGYRGAAVSVSVSYWFNLLLLALFVIWSPSCKKTWDGLSREAFHGLWDFLKLGIPSGLMVCLQNWQFELLLLLSGLLKDPQFQTSVMSISQNISALVFMIPIGVSGAVSTRISNELGAGNPKTAELSAHTAGLTIIVEGATTGLAMIGGRNFWGRAFNNERKVVEAVAGMMPWIALSHFIDGLQNVLLGTIRGSGRQKIGAFVCLGSYYFIGIPSSILLGFVFHRGVKGLWMGNICAIFVQDVVLLIITALTNWEKQAVKAMERVQDQKESVPKNKMHDLEDVRSLKASRVVVEVELPPCCP